MARSPYKTMAVVVENIKKVYEQGKIVALEDISFKVSAGEIFGLIGPDGAGKTSLFRILTTLLLPDHGSAEVLGLDVVHNYKTIRQKIGYMPGKFSLYQDLSVQENLDFFATLFDTTVQENYYLIEDIFSQLEPFSKRRAGQLSGGMKQKLALSCALIHKPDILFLDEPTTGVDAVSRKEFWEMLKKLRDQGITIIVSTPYMDEANLCDRIALIQNGKIMSIATPEKIIQQYPQKLFRARSSEMGRLVKDLRSLSYVSSCFAFGSYHHFTFSDERDSTDALESDLKHHVELHIENVKPTIEDCFIHLMQSNA